MEENISEILRLNLDEIAQKYSQHIKKVIETYTTEDVALKTGEFKIIASKNENFALSYNLVFECKNDDFIRVEKTSSALDAKIWLTPEAWQELQIAGEKSFSVDIPKPKIKIPDYSCRRKFNLTGNSNLEKIKIWIDISFLFDNGPFKIKIFTFGGGKKIDTDAVEIVGFESLVDLSRVPNDADKIYFVLVPEDGDEYSSLGYVYLGIEISNAYVVYPDIAKYDFEGHTGNPSPEAPFQEANLFIGELSREGGDWFFNVVVKDFSNRDEFGKFFGIED